MAKTTHDLLMKQLSKEQLAELASFANTPAGSIDEIERRQTAIADACLGLHKSILSLVEMIQTIEDRRSV